MTEKVKISYSLSFVEKSYFDTEIILNQRAFVINAYLHHLFYHTTTIGQLTPFKVTRRNPAIMLSQCFDYNQRNRKQTKLKKKKHLIKI